MKRLPILSLSLASALAAGAWLSQAVPVSAVADDTGQQSSTATDQAAAEPEPDQQPAQPALTALELLQKAREALVYNRSSVSATLHEKVAISGTPFEASGTYAAGTFPRLRLSVQVAVGSTTGNLLEVCDGQVLWTVQEIQVAGRAEPTTKISRTVIAEVLSAWEENLDVPEAVLTAKLGVGGLPALLAALERSMIFDAVKAAEYDGQPYFVIQGRWRSEYLTRLGGGGGKALPEYVPDRVRVYFDQQTLFPTRILYLKKTTTESALPYQLLLSLEFSDIVLDGPVDEEQFRYVPPDEAQVENRTSKILGLIEAAKKPAATPGGTP